MPTTLSDLPDLLPRQSQSFVLRAWREDVGGDLHEWRAFVRHVLSGETRFIRSWQELEVFLEAFGGGKADDPSPRSHESS